MSTRHEAGSKRYMLADFAAAFIGWLLFFIQRRNNIEHVPFEHARFIDDPNFIAGGLVVSCFWVFVFTLTNSYHNIYEKSRTSEVLKTLIISLFGNIFLFFLLVLNDNISDYKDYYYLIWALFSTHIIPTLTFRLILLFKAKTDMRNGKVSFSTLLIGNHKDLPALYKEIVDNKQNHGLDIQAILTDSPEKITDKPLLRGSSNNISPLIESHSYRYAILALSREEKDKMPQYIRLLDENGIAIKLLPELTDSLTGNIKLTNPVGAQLVDVDTDIMKPWQRVVKRGFDLFVSLSALLLLSPLMIAIAILVKRSSPGPVLYRQERIGFKGKPFTIYKFRSMYVDAEAHGPQLSKDGDERTTGIGHFIRKYRLDELPQFYNVLTGEMSLVGPRPERAYFARQIIAQAPEYKYVYKIKPGITSWGMVRYGYASNTKEMLERMKYDLLYINNFSLLMDLRILIYTVLTVIKGRGV